MAQIIPLSEGEFTIGYDKIFHPFNVATDELQDKPRGSLLVEVQPFLIITSKDILLLDTGLGFKNSEGKLQIHENLRTHGYEPEQVTKILMSHLHKDHAGGVIYKNEKGIAKTSFPRADYYVYGPEAAYAMETGKPSYMPDELDPLFDSGQVQWLQGAEGTIEDYIHFTHSGAHCPQHIVFLIEDEDRKIFFGGDEAPQYKQMIHKYVAKYDFDGKKAMELREKYAAQGRAENWEFLFYHDIKAPVTRLAADD